MLFWAKLSLIMSPSAHILHSTSRASRPLFTQIYHSACITPAGFPSCKICHKQHSARFLCTIDSFKPILMLHTPSQSHPLQWPHHTEFGPNSPFSWTNHHYTHLWASNNLPEAPPLLLSYHHLSCNADALSISLDVSQSINHMSYLVIPLLRLWKHVQWSFPSVQCLPSQVLDIWTM